MAATLVSQPLLGRISFPNSGSPVAQTPFVRGVLLLHSIEYDDHPNLSSTDLATADNYEDRLAPADHWFADLDQPAGFSLIAFGNFGNTPRTIRSLRTPPQYNMDATLMNDFYLVSS
jgi:hypothetical protein